MAAKNVTASADTIRTKRWERSMRGPYIEYAEQLWRSWLERTTQVPATLHRIFSLEAIPEPYVLFRAGANPLVVLLTNPGGVLLQQLRTTVESGLGPVNPSMDYAKVASTMGEFYLRELRGPAAHRIAAVRSGAVGCPKSRTLGHAHASDLCARARDDTPHNGQTRSPRA